MPPQCFHLQCINQSHRSTVQKKVKNQPTRDVETRNSKPSYGPEAGEQNAVLIVKRPKPLPRRIAQNIWYNQFPLVGVWKIHTEGDDQNKLINGGSHQQNFWPPSFHFWATNKNCLPRIFHTQGIFKYKRTIHSAWGRRLRKE